MRSRTLPRKPHAESYAVSEYRTTGHPRARNADIIGLVAKEYVEERDGGYYVAGTRISLDSIVQCFNEGLSPEAILGEFETLTLAQVFGAIAFYLENQRSIDSYRMRQIQRFEAKRRAANPLPAELRERLDAARDQLHSSHRSR